MSKEGITWVHLSDIHFGHNKKSIRYRLDQTLACDKIINDAINMATKIGPPDFIFISGDIAFNACKNHEYKAAEKWIDKFIDSVGGNQRRTYVVPGNHDVDRSFIDGKLLRQRTQEHYINNHNNIDEIIHDKDISDLILPKFDNYLEFSKKYGASFQSTNKVFWIDKAIDTPLGKVSLVGLNTSLLSYIKDKEKGLSIGNSQRLTLSDISQSKNLLFILQHHPMSWLSDGDKIQKDVIACPHFIFSGHLHNANASFVAELGSGSLVSFSAGATYSHPDPKQPNHAYSWGNLCPKGLTYYPRVWDDTEQCFLAKRSRDRLDKNEGIYVERSQLPKPLKDWLPPLKTETETIETPSSPGKIAETLATIVRQTICYTQGEYSQFSTFANKFLEKLKDQSQKDPYNFPRLKSTIETLDTYLARNTEICFVAYFEQILDYFDKTNSIRRSDSDTVPRISIKSNLLRPDSSDKIVTIARCQGIERGFEPEINVDDNTGFQEIARSGMYYFCSDIPKETKLGQYRNPRLIDEKVKNYSSSDKIKGIDKNWANCWKRHKRRGKATRNDDGSCYKSTLIIPMTLKNNKLEKEFVSYFSMQTTDGVSATAINRSILGYLCFDHVDPEYFDEKLDPQIGYIYADILSLYMLTNFYVTKVDSVYKKIKSVLENVEDSS